MPKDEIRWTPQQHQAISARGSDVLVTASAGTGKTAVLSGRCVDFLSDGKTCADVTSLLVLTFTDAAAEEMRSRIGRQLKAEIQRTGRRNLIHQLVLLQAADISTIHAFCKRLITEHFFQLDLDPTFKVIDADEAKLLKTEILQKTVDWAWHRPEVAAVLGELLARRDVQSESGFLRTLIETSDFLEGVVSRRRWFERAETLLEQTALDTSQLAALQRRQIEEQLRRILARLDYARSVYARQLGEGPWLEKLQQTHVAPIEQCIQSAADGRWGRLADIIQAFNPRTCKPKELDEPLKSLLGNLARKAVTEVQDLRALAVVNPDYMQSVGSSVGRQTGVFLEMLRTFGRLYTEAKRSANCLDFSDLEHLALRLLTESDTDEPQPSKTALELRRKYAFIFVDEYQDINPVQQTILDMLRGGDNVFVVGDVKQSIYAWRGARPDIFLRRLESGRAAPPASLRIDLNTNFRSKLPILRFVNSVFSRLMTKPFCGMDYDRKAHLHHPSEDDRPAETAGGDNPYVEFHLLDETDKDADDDHHKFSESDAEARPELVSARQRQAALIAERIRQMVGAETGRAEFQVMDKAEDRPRDVRYGDIVILLRSLAGRANDYVEILRLAGIPVSCQTTAGYFEATEITDMLCLLKVLDNPMRDIELAAILRSPMFGLTDSDLAAIQVHRTDETPADDYCAKVRRYADGGPDASLAEKLTDILTTLDHWRAVARRGNLADLIWHIYRRTDYLSFVSALPDGRARRANLLKLHDRAVQFEGFASSPGAPSLTRFVDFLQKLQDTGQDWTPAEPEAAAGNAVRILSVHKSKGLEFPVVFLAELQSQFNTRDLAGDVLSDAEAALGLQIIDPASNVRLSSLAHQVIAEQKRRVALAEEMRILYVAATRARERLILTATDRKDRSGGIVAGGACFECDPVPDWCLRSCRCPLDWLLLALANCRTLHAGLETGLADRTAEGNLFAFHLLDRSQLDRLSRTVETLRIARIDDRQYSPKKKAGKASSSLSGRIKESLSWRYAFGNVPALPAKSSVTELTHQGDEFARLDFSGALSRQPSVLIAEDPDRLVVPSPTALGSAMHLVISEIDLSRAPVDERAIHRTIENLLDRGALTARMAEHIDVASILSFFAGDLGQKAVDPENQVLREWPFTFALPAREFPGPVERGQSETEEAVVVQGIIDMLIRTPDGLYIIDFKTDNITTAEIDERANLYRPQLDLYARAAATILSAEPVVKSLYFLRPRRMVQW